MTQRPTPPSELPDNPDTHLPIGMTDARYGGTGAPPQDQAPTSGARGYVYEFRIASQDAQFHVELVRVTVNLFGRAQRKCVGLTDGPFHSREDAEAALTRRWNDYRRAMESSPTME
jgi:hypothetical protein